MRHGFQGVDHLFKSIGFMAVIGVSVGNVFAVGSLDAPVPGCVDVFTRVSSDIHDVIVTLLKSLDDGSLVLLRAAVNDNDLELVRNRLGLQILKATTNEALGFVGRDNSGN